VSGRVQGVFFRASTRSRARELGLTGWALNRTDGTVEVLVCGEPSAVDRLCDWLWQGPDAARVDRVECAPAAVDPPQTFTTR
jgi:acylphosphatase